MFGGYDPAAGWRRDAAGFERTVLRGEVLPLGAFAMVAPEVNEPTEVQGVRVVAPDAEGRDDMGRGTGSYALRALSGTGTLTVRNAVLEAGRGADGQPGTEGESGGPGADGAPGNEVCFIGCDGGDGGSWAPLPRGGAGGPGGPSAGVLLGVSASVLEDGDNAYELGAGGALSGAPDDAAPEGPGGAQCERLQIGTGGEPMCS